MLTFSYIIAFGVYITVKLFYSSVILDFCDTSLIHLFFLRWCPEVPVCDCTTIYTADISPIVLRNTDYTLQKLRFSCWCEAKFKILARRPLLISFFSVLDENKCAMNNACWYTSLQISVQFQFPACNYVKHMFWVKNYYFW